MCVCVCVCGGGGHVMCGGGGFGGGLSQYVCVQLVCWGGWGGESMHVLVVVGGGRGGMWCVWWG